MLQRFLGLKTDNESHLCKNQSHIFPPWEYNTAGIVEIEMVHFPRPKAQALVLWGAQRYVTCREDLTSKDNALWRYQEVTAYVKCGETMAHWAANLST